MDISIIQATIKDAADILTLQKVAYQSEAKLNDDWSIPPLMQTLSEIEAEFEKEELLAKWKKEQDSGFIEWSVQLGRKVKQEGIKKLEKEGLV